MQQPFQLETAATTDGRPVAQQPVLAAASLSAPDQVEQGERFDLAVDWVVLESWKCDLAAGRWSHSMEALRPRECWNWRWASWEFYLCPISSGAARRPFARSVSFAAFYPQ